MESYLYISTQPSLNGPICNRCHIETNVHHFSKWNNMDLGAQPIVLSILTQVEEMLISRISPILQVIHARGGQCKYIGHTISFPQQIVQISNCLPRKLSEIDILIVKRQEKKGKCYDCYVTKSLVVNAFLYKIQNDKYYSDVQLDHASISSLPEACTDVSSQLHFVSTEIDISPLMDSSILDLENQIAT